MRPFEELLPREEALRRLLDAARPVGRSESVPLREARGRASAEDVEATVAVPPFARSMMDGYAVRSADGAAPRSVVGEAFAGHGFPGVVHVGEAVRIATGAPLPIGADTVVRVEDAREEGMLVYVSSAPRAGQSTDPAGSDVGLGSPIVTVGTVLTPARLGLLASVGRSTVRVHARPRVAVLPTGDELVAPGAPPRADAIYDSNSTSLAAIFETAGCTVTAHPAVRDDMRAIEGALVEASRANDIVVLSGGASVGSRDLVVDALLKHGEVLLHGVRVKPGKPLLVGRIGDTLIIGLPGNPTSALSNAALFVLPTLRKLAGLPPLSERTVEAELSMGVEGNPRRFLFLPVKLDSGRAIPTFKGSGALTSFSESDGWVGVPEGVNLKSGSRVVVTLWP
ncbi:MAG: gephyrin-like molybdotransferase Glp [Candidatus Thermoplasmatota archaeon]